MRQILPFPKVLLPSADTVGHALSILGEREVRRWIRLVAALGAGQGKSSDLVLAALVRARFCELLSSRVQPAGSDLFLMGMLSMMDAIPEIPMRQVLDNVPIDQESKAVQLGLPSALQPFYQLMLAQESGNWVAAGARRRDSPQRSRGLGSLLDSDAMGTGDQCGKIG